MAKKKINIFSVSFLDVMCCALGAVLLLYVIVPKVTMKEAMEIREHREIIEQIDDILEQLENSVERELLERIQNEIESLKRKISNIVQENQRLRQELEAAQQTIDEYENELRESNFIVITMSWKTEKQDVDLWVIDPQGRKYYFEKRNYIGIPGNLAADTLVGPGVEVWEVLNPIEGKYRIYANLYAKKGNNDNPVVKTRLFYRKGAKELNQVILSTENKEGSIRYMKYIGAFNVSDSGMITF